MIPVNIHKWYAGIERFHSHLVILKTKKKLSDPVIIFTCIFIFFYNVVLSILILKAGGIELNPGPPKNSHSYFSCCHWNANSLATDNYSKFVALKVYITNMILYVLVKLFLILQLSQVTKTLLEGYNLIRSDHPSNTKRGGVCICYKESLAVRLVDITSLPECLVCELTMQNKKGYVAVMYRSPSQSSIEFESFLSGFEDMLSSVLFSKSQFTVILGDFNARSSS